MSKIEKIMLALPNDRWFGNRHWHGFPYTFGVLSSVLKDNYDVKVLDASFENLDYGQVKKRIEEYKPDILGINCMSMEYTKHFQKLASISKEVCPETKIVVGGIYPTLLPKVLIKNKNIDYVVIGEGEFRFPNLLKALKNPNVDLSNFEGIAFNSPEGIKVNPIQNYIQDLDSLPLPFYGNINLEGYANKANKYAYYTYPNRFPYATTITSRGCPFKCIFCSSEKINGPKIRYRSAESVLKEVDWLVEEYGMKEIIFMDDNLYLDSKRLDKILDGLIERNYDLEWKAIAAAVYALNDSKLKKMRRSGCYQLSLAVEAGSKEGLKRLNKPTSIIDKIKPLVKTAKSLDYEIGGMFIIGTPGETWEDIRQTINLAEELDLDYSAFNVCTPLLKTKLYDLVKKDNLIPKDFNFDSLDFKGFGRATITTNEFTPEEIQIVRAFEWDRINFKTQEKREKIAKMCGINLQELNDWRVSTRRGLGVKVRYK